VQYTTFTAVYKLSPTHCVYPMCSIFS
jgi:hypothetical protein